MKNKKDKDEVVDNESINNETENKQNQDTEIGLPAEEVDIVAKLSEEVATWQDKYIRLSADFDNFRKRTLKEKMDLIEFGGEDVIKSMLTVIDDMARGVEANKKSENIKAIREGAELIYNKMKETIKQKGVSEINALGEKFDTDLHDAITKFPVEDSEKKGRVIDVIEKGYKLKDKVIRYAKVVVGE